MAIRITCPDCKTALTLDEDKRGRKVRCRSCQKVLSIPAANASKRETETEEALQQGRKLKVKTAPAPEEEEQLEEEDRPAKKKKKGKKAKKGSSSTLLFVIGAVAILLLLLVGGGGTAYYFLKPEPERPKTNPQAKVDPPPQPQGNNPIGGKVVREPKSFIGNMRAQGDRIERANEMKQIALFYQQYCDTITNPNSRNLDGFLNFMKRDSIQIHDAIKDKHYTVNLRAKLGSTDILVYETELYTVGYYAYRANNEIGHVTDQELKAGLPQ